MGPRRKLAVAGVASGLLVLGPATAAGAEPVTDDQQLQFGFTGLDGTARTCTVNAYSTFEHFGQPADAAIYVDVLVEDDPGCRAAASFSTVDATYDTSHGGAPGALSGSGAGWYATAGTTVQDTTVSNVRGQHRVWFRCRDSGGQPSLCEALVRTGPK
jgi:hypothetical protein